MSGDIVAFSPPLIIREAGRKALAMSDCIAVSQLLLMVAVDALRRRGERLRRAA